MAALVDVYRGYEIYFSTDREKFYAAIDDVSWSKDKTSYSAAKKSIDDFIKENVEFKPFYVVKLESYSGQIKERVKIVGIRKDGRFICEKEGGKKEQVAEYYESSFFLESNEEYKAMANEINRLSNLIKPLSEERDNVLKKLESLPNLKNSKVKYKI